jgi:endonuclease-8
MPEGPSILIAREAMLDFVGRKVIAAEGNAKLDKSLLRGQTLLAIRTWGKHLLICFPTFTLRVHFLMFGTYLINDRKKTPLRLSLQFKKGEINFYTAAIRMITGPLDQVYDFSADVLSDQWNPRKASAKLRKDPLRLVCDVLLDQEIFSGVGNIIKNEVLFRIRVHPESRVGQLPPAKKSALVREARNYSFDFLRWKREYVLKKHWLIYTKKTCPRDHHKVSRAHLGAGKRRTFYCNHCQLLYD